LKRIPVVPALITALILAAPARAGLLVTGTISPQADGPNRDDTIAPNDSGASTDSVTTFWYARVPGKDSLTTSPLSVSVPTGWTGMITRFPNAPANGYAIQSVTSIDPSRPAPRWTSSSPRRTPPPRSSAIRWRVRRPDPAPRSGGPSRPD